MDREKLTPTKGLVAVNWDNSTHVCLKEKATGNKTVASLSAYYNDKEVTSFEELASNSHIMADAINTFNKCENIPSELLQLLQTLFGVYNAQTTLSQDLYEKITAATKSLG